MLAFNLDNKNLNFQDGGPTIFCNKGVPAEAATCFLVPIAWFLVHMVTAFNGGDTAEFLTCSVVILATHKGDPQKCTND